MNELINNNQQKENTIDKLGKTSQEITEAIITPKLNSKRREKLLEIQNKVKGYFKDENSWKQREGELVWDHITLPLQVKVAIGLPIIGEGGRQYEQNDYQVSESGKHIYKHTFRRDQYTSFVYNSIYKVVNDLREKYEQELVGKEKKQLKELGWIFYANQQAEKILTEPLLKEIAKEVNQWFYDYRFGVKKEEGWEKGNWDVRQNWDDKVQELLYTKKPSWKSDYRDNETFQKELRQLSYNEFADKLTDLQDSIIEEQETKTLTDFVNKQWINDDTIKKYISLYLEVLKGNGTIEEVDNQAFQEVKKQFPKIRELKIKYALTGHLSSFINHAKSNLVEEKKNWTTEQWKSYVPRDSEGKLRTPQWLGLEDWETNMVKYFFTENERKNYDEAERKSRELNIEILAGGDFFYKCRHCKEAGNVRFRSVFRSRYTAIYQCSRCENTEYKVDLFKLKEKIDEWREEIKENGKEK